MMDEIKDSAQKILENLDKLWNANMSTAMHEARQKAERDGHRYRVIDRESFRAVFTYMIKMEE